VCYTPEALDIKLCIRLQTIIAQALFIIVSICIRMQKIFRVTSGLRKITSDDKHWVNYDNFS
ncbi:uncharacterized protein METZ01_LOCUS152250, partial [marine metagenome]